MQLCLVEFTKPNTETGLFFSESFADAISQHNIEEIVIFQPTLATCLPLQEELKSMFPKALIRPEPLEPLSADILVSEMKQQPWQLLRQILSKIDEVQDCLFVLGRGASLLQHLMWLAAEIRGSETICLDAPGVELLHSGVSKIKTGISNATLGAFAGLYAQEINDKVHDKDGWFSANDLAKFPGAVASGINSATQLSVSKGDLLKEETKSGNTVYKLSLKGWPSALESFFASREHSDRALKDLLVSFARLPKIQVQDGETAPPPLLSSQISPSQPFDALLVVLQRYDNAVEGSHVMTLDGACEFFKDSTFIGDLRAAKEILRQRCALDSVQAKNHLVVINPDYNDDFQLRFSKQLLAALLGFEKEHGQHCWNFDITSPLNPIKVAVSAFSNACNAPTSYILKSQGEDGVVIKNVPPSRHPRNSHKLSVPNRFALDVMKTNHKPGYRNNLIALMLLEDCLTKNTGGGLPFDDVDDGQFDGVTWAEIVTFVRDLECPYDLKTGIISGSQSRMKPLAIQKLIVRHVPDEGSSKIRYTLTNEGYLVASQLYGAMRKEEWS
jgi:hypothetical protein